MIHIQFPPPELAIQHWDELYKFLSLAVDASNGELDEVSVKNQVEDGDLLAAAVYDDQTLIAVVAFELLLFTTDKRVMNIQLAGGDNLEVWFERMDEVAQALAKARDCSEVYIVGRPGWQRKLKQLGYQTVHTVLRKEVK
jgi:hypothetical protein